jgi:hypothetical protein
MNDETRRYEPSASLPVGKVLLPEGLQIVDVETSLDGLVTQERALTRYLPQGWASPTWIHLVDEDDREYTLIIHPLTGRAKIRDGRVRMGD